MELGQRIKAARLEAGLSQRQLCADVITRNMLSQIENGSARPSMDTLSHFARQLGKPVSFFLEEDAVTSPNQAVLEQARLALQAGEFGQVRKLLLQYREPDETFDWEKALLLALAALKLGEQAVQENRMPYAQHLLEEAGREGAKTPYYLPETEQKRQLLLHQAGGNGQLPNADAVLLCRAEDAMAQGQTERAAVCLDACEERSIYWRLLRGQICLEQAQYSRALPFLQAAEEAYPRETLPLLERCYSALEDYKMAYLYACKQKSGAL